MFSELNPLGRDTAILEILIMLLGAFLIGFFTAWLIQQARRKKGNDQSENSEAVMAAARAKNQELKKKLEEQRKMLKDIEARKTAAETRANELQQEVKALRKGGKGKAAVAVAGGVAWEEEKTALENKIKEMEKTVRDNRSEMGRAAAFRKEIKELKLKLEEAEKKGETQSEGPDLKKGKEIPANGQAELTALKGDLEASEKKLKASEKELTTAKGELAKVIGELATTKEALEKARAESKQAASHPKAETSGETSKEGEDLNREMIRMRAEMATHEASARRAEYKVKQLEKDNKGIVKERDQALERLDELQFKMDKLQRQVETMRVNASRMDLSPSAATRQNRPSDPGSLTSLKGLGNRSAEFLEKLGITTMERLAETDENTQQHIARNLGKSTEVVQGWVNAAKNILEATGG